jgi:hypothetical protein
MHIRVGGHEGDLAAETWLRTLNAIERLQAKTPAEGECGEPLHSPEEKPDNHRQDDRDREPECDFQHGGHCTAGLASGARDLTPRPARALPFRRRASAMHHQHQQANESEGPDKHDDAQEAVQHQPREDGDGLNQSPAAWRGGLGGCHSILNT